MNFIKTLALVRWLCSAILVIAVGMIVFSPQSFADPTAQGKRPAWTISRVKGSPEPPLPYRAQRVFPQLGFTQPTVLTSAPGTERLFVAEQAGRIYSIPNDPNCQKADLFLETAKLVEKLNASRNAAEQVDLVAVYGLTFHPDFSTNRRCYVCYAVRYKDGSRGQHPSGTRVVQLLANTNDPPSAWWRAKQKSSPGWRAAIMADASNSGQMACFTFPPAMAGTRSRPMVSHLARM